MIDLIAFGLAFAGFVAAVLAMWRVATVERRLRALESERHALTEQLQGLTAGALGHDQHLARLREDIARVRARLEHVAVNDSGGGPAFGQAIRMARKGLSAQEIMQTCGITQMEADLVILLHRDREAQ